MEKEWDDEVYEDEYYDDNYEEEELEDENDLIEDEDDDKELVADKNDDDDDEEDDDQEWDEGDKKIHLSFACEDCDYRWDDVIIKTRGGNLEDEEDEYEVACPMCGSMTVTQI